MELAGLKDIRENLVDQLAICSKPTITPEQVDNLIELGRQTESKTQILVDAISRRLTWREREKELQDLHATWNCMRLDEQSEKCGKSKSKKRLKLRPG